MSTTTTEGDWQAALAVFERRYRGGAKDRSDKLFLHAFANKILTTGAAQLRGSIQSCETKPRPRYGHVVRRA
jgi:hypothetical protein